jgi:hypothetical protein
LEENYIYFNADTQALTADVPSLLGTTIEGIFVVNAIPY